MKEAEKVKNRQRATAWALANPERRREYLAQYYVRNREKALAASRLWVANHAEESAARSAAYRALHRKEAAERSRRRRLEKPGEINALGSKRRAQKLNATPKWLTVAQLRAMESYYVLGRAIGYHVDHRVPLAGKNVCGLHVPWNLQLLHPVENLAKKNQLLEAHL